MNVLFADQFGELGGAQRCLLDLMPAVLKQGWRAFAAVPPGDLAAGLVAAGVTVHEIHVGDYRAGRKSLGDVIRFLRAAPRLSSELRDCIRKHQIDLLYVNGPRLLPAACLASKIPILFHAHSYLPKGISRELALSSLRFRRVPTIAVSLYVASYLAGAVSPDRLYVIRNGVADAARTRSRVGTPRIGIIGRIAPEKGQLEFVEAGRLLPRDWSFLICGAPLLGTPEYADRVHASAVGLPIEFVGWQQDVSAVLANLDVLVVPSAGNEALGRVILEAFSAEVPVVAFRSGGIPELIEDGQTGFLVDGRSPQALADRIRMAVDDPARRQSVARNARKLWESHYTLERYRGSVIRVMAAAAAKASAAAASKTGG